MAWPVCGMAAGQECLGRAAAAGLNNNNKEWGGGEGGPFMPGNRSPLHSIPPAFIQPAGGWAGRGGRRGAPNYVIGNT